MIFSRSSSTTATAKATPPTAQATAKTQAKEEDLIMMYQSATDELQQQQQQHEPEENDCDQQDQLSLSSLESELHTGDDYLDELLQQALNSKFFLDDDYQNCLVSTGLSREHEDDDEEEDLEDNLQEEQEETSARPNANAGADANNVDASETVSSDIFDLDWDLDLDLDESGRYSCLDTDMDMDASVCEWKNVSKHPKLSTVTATSSSSSRPNLSQLMKQRQWQLIPPRLAKHPQEASRLIFLPQVPKGMLPLHFACAIRPLPPPQIVKLLLEVYPEAVTEPEANWGMLPLHLAVDLDPSIVFVTGSYHQQPNDDDEPDVSTANDYLQQLQQAYFGNNDNEHHHHQQQHQRKTAPIESIHFRTFPEPQEHPQQRDTDYHTNPNTNPNDQPEIVTMLLDLYPQAITLRETSQGRMPLHIAASTTICNHKGFIPPTSHSIFQLLTQKMTNQEIQEPTYAWENAIDMTKRNIKKQKKSKDDSRLANGQDDNCWLPHPLLWQNNNKNHQTKIHTCNVPSPSSPEIKKTTTDSDTDATSITTSLSYSMSEDTNTTYSSGAVDSPQQMQWKQQWKQQQRKQQWTENNADVFSMYEKK